MKFLYVGLCLIGTLLLVVFLLPNPFQRIELPPYTGITHQEYKARATESCARANGELHLVEIKEGNWKGYWQGFCGIEDK